MTFSTITISQKFVIRFVTKCLFLSRIEVIFVSLRIKVTKFIFADKTAPGNTWWYQAPILSYFYCFFLVTVPIISDIFLKVYRWRQEKSTNVRFLFCTFFYHYYSIFHHAAWKYSSIIKSSLCTKHQIMLAESSSYGSFHNCSMIISWVTICLEDSASRYRNAFSRSFRIASSCSPQ